jgi:hypothetical protein
MYFQKKKRDNQYYCAKAINLTRLSKVVGSKSSLLLNICHFPVVVCYCPGSMHAQYAHEMLDQMPLGTDSN